MRIHSKRILRSAALVLAVASLMPLHAQYGAPRRRSSPRTDVGRGGKLEGQPLVTLHGVVREVTKKWLTIEAADDQVMKLEVNKKTKFLKANRPVDAKAVLEGAAVSVEVSGQ